ncbi:MAG TPA: DUF6709 family protein [Candidatus Angelobacter sp.]|jgi:hypothetical protein|nr:DUF6709 family protein [Candidatus Angelobacter sp.]
MALWVETEARRANRNLILVNGVIAALVILAVAVNSRYCANFVLGCEPISATELATLKSPDQRWRNFVKVTGTKSFNTGYRDIVQHVEKGSGRVVSTEVKDEYVLLSVAGNILLVKAPTGQGQLDYSGELVPTPEQVNSDLLVPLGTQQPDARAMVLPFTLNAADYRDNGYTILIVCLPFFALAMWNCLKAARRMSELQLSPVWKHLAAFGDAQQISSQIEAELQPGATRAYGKLQLTQQWMVRRKFFSTWVSPVGDLVWIYKKVTKHSVNFIPTGKTYSLVMAGRHRQRLEEQMKEKTVNDLLNDLAGRVPWALFGFDQKLEQTWRKTPDQFISAVDARYQQYKAKAAGASAPG